MTIKRAYKEINQDAGLSAAYGGGELKAPAIPTNFIFEDGNNFIFENGDNFILNEVTQ